MLFVSLGVGCSIKTNKTLDVCTHFMQKYTKGKYNEGYKKNLSTRKIMKMVASIAKKENLLKRHIIPSHKNEMYYVDSKYHKTSRENMNPGALCEKNLYPRTTHRDTVREILGSIHITVLCVAKN